MTQSRFTPGPCPGKCGRMLESREDCHLNRLACQECGQRSINEAQQRLRESRKHKCLDCPKMCGRGAVRCRECSAAIMRTLVRPEVKPEVKPARGEYRAFTGLRGEGGELTAFLRSKAGIPVLRKRGV